MNGSRIGYERLSPKDRALYEKIEKAFAAGSDHFECSRFLQNEEIMRVFQIALGDHPSVVYLDRTHLQISSSVIGEKKVYFTDVASMLKRRKKDSDLENAVKRTTASIGCARPATPVDTLIGVYTYLQDHVRYDDREKAASIRTGERMDPEAHSAYGALVNGRATCDGFAAAFALLAQTYGFDCTVVSGKLSDGQSPGVEHAWNVIKAGNTYCHCDVTVDAGQGLTFGTPVFDCFCVTDEEIRGDHSWTPSACPPCTGREWSYYGNRGWIASNGTQLDEILKKQFREGRKEFHVRIAPKSSLQSVNGAALADRLLNTAASFGRYGRIRYMWNENSRCFHARFE